MPTAVKVARGMRPSRINHEEPQALAGEVMTPPGLSPLAAEEWRKVAPDLLTMGVLARTDAAGLAVYCEAVARWRNLALLVADAPPLIEGERGMVTNPLYRLIRDAAAEVRVWAREFGLTPSARSGIHVTHHVAGEGDPGRLLTGTEG